jgi:hypothetical protein
MSNRKFSDYCFTVKMEVIFVSNLIQFLIINVLCTNQIEFLISTKKNEGEQTMKRAILKTVIAGLFIGLFFTSISAQNFLFQNMPKNKPQLGLRFMRPNFDGDDDLSILSGTYDLCLNIPISPKLNLVGSLPYTTFSAKGEDSESGIGSIYVGIQTKIMSESGNNSSLSMGIFLPTAKDEFYPMFLGVYSNYYEFQKYFPDMLTVYGIYSYFKNQSRGAIFGIEIGPNLFIRNSSPPLLILLLISEHGLTIYDFRSIIDFLNFDFSGGNPSKIKNR